MASAAAAAAGVIGAPLISCAFRSRTPPPRLYHYTSLNFASFNGHHCHYICRSTAARASRRSVQPPQENESDPIDDLQVSEEDVNYLWKLAAGSAGGAAAIKYGSIIFPDITRPNILEALVMISLPVVVAVVILIRESMKSERDDLL